MIKLSVIGKGREAFIVTGCEAWGLVCVIQKITQKQNTIIGECNRNRD